MISGGVCVCVCVDSSFPGFLEVLNGDIKKPVNISTCQWGHQMLKWRGERSLITAEKAGDYLGLQNAMALAV